MAFGYRAPGSTAIFAVLLWAYAAASATAATNDPYMGGAAETAVLKNGARINSEFLKGSLGGHSPQIRNIAAGVWAIIGRSIVNVYVIEGKQGLIVYDTGFNEAEGKAILSDIRTFSDRPVSAIIYSHTHYPHGAAVLVEGRDIPVIGRAEVNSKATASGLGGAFTETMPVQFARADEQMGMALPLAGRDAAAGHHFDDPWGKKAFLPVNKVPEDGEEIELDGIKFVFFTKNDADSESLTAWLPDRKIVLNNFYWPTAANFYAPRGDEFRDARKWIRGLKIIRDLHPEILLSTHAMPLSGGDEIQRKLEEFIDFHSMIMDQSLRGILKGLGAEELRYFVDPPPSLRGVTQNYGESMSWYPPSVYYETMGWFSGDAADLNPPPSEFVAQKLVEQMGGAQGVLRAAAEAERREEWAWALQLVNYLHKSDPANQQARQVKARLLRKHAELTSSSIAHNFYMTQALQLEGRLKTRTRSYPQGYLQNTPACGLVDNYRVRIIPERTEGLHGIIAFQIPGEFCALAIRPGVAEYIDNPKKDEEIVINTTKDDIIRLYKGEISLKDLVANMIPSNSPVRERAIALGSVFEVLGEGEAGDTRYPEFSQ